MVSVGLLLAYAAVFGWVGDRALARAHWPVTAPWVALLLWHASAAGVLLAIGWGLVLLAHDVAEHGLSWFFKADKTLMHLAYAPEVEVPTYWNATIVLLMLGLSVCGLAALRRARTGRAITEAHDLVVTERLSMVTKDGEALSVGVCRSPIPVVYCLPWRRSDERIRASTGALEVLNGDEFRAAIEHEQAHLAYRHHAQVLFAESAVAALRWSGLLKHYPQAVKELIEYQADDYAAEHHGPRTVAEALFAMATAGPAPTTPAGTAWTGGTPSLRISRLMSSRRRPHMLLRGLVASAAALVAVTPSLAAVAPALSVADTRPVSVTHHEESPAETDFEHHP